MNISSVANSMMSLANLATEMKGSKISQEVGIAVLKQTMDMQQNVADALVRMIDGTPPAGGDLGSIIDIQA